MRVLLQRVREASVIANGKLSGEIKKGVLLLVSIEESDVENDITWLANKITNLRIFPDSEGVMNLSLLDIDGEALVVSQFTLHASTKKGNRPSYIKAAKPDFANKMYELFKQKLQNLINQRIASGVFGADMQISLTNNGPVTIWLDSKNKE
ncbi:MAG: D-tyrosyl-tRNA(Tyr) deacylase [Flavobacteriales bacterium]|jgi:D-tyrosyl-tRNA(Tyr) deacylase